MKRFQHPDCRPVLGQRCCSRDPGDPLNWLGRISSAAHKLNYTGSFTYQSGKNIETSRIAHLVDGNGENTSASRRWMAARGRSSATR